jgi:hypothetical protein
MTRDDEGRPAPSDGDAGGERSGARDARGGADEREAGQVPAPTPEEAPELLGEQSDYPIAWEPAAGDDGEHG